MLFSILLSQSQIAYCANKTKQNLAASSQNRTHISTTNTVHSPNRIASLRRPTEIVDHSTTKRSPDCDLHYLNYLNPSECDAWAEQNRPVHVSVKAPDKVKCYSPKMLQWFKESCAAWTEATDGLVEFEFGLRAEEGNGIKLEFADTKPAFIGRDTAGTTQTNHDDDGITVSRIVLYTRENDGKPPTEHAFRHTCMHEIGHALGIAGHSPNKNDIMVATHVESPFDDPKTLRLSARDIQTIKFIYRHADTFFARAKARVESRVWCDPEEADRRLKELASNYDGPDIRKSIAELRRQIDINLSRERASRLRHTSPGKV